MQQQLLGTWVNPICAGVAESMHDLFLYYHRRGGRKKHTLQAL
jgi:hypothetical protein